MRFEEGVFLKPVVATQKELIFLAGLVKPLCDIKIDGFLKSEPILRNYYFQ
jgi:hypothetical protein